MRNRQTETKKVTRTETRTVSEVVTCDICGLPSKNRRPTNGDYVTNWTEDNQFDFNRTAVIRQQGYSCSDGGDYKTESYHVCYDCWPKLAAWIASFRGAEPTRDSVDW
jgi:hypothetical protein